MVNSSIGSTECVSFSFVMPVRNELADVEFAIHAVEQAALEAAPVEIIAVDDASTDGTRELLRRYAKAGRIRLIEQSEKRGAAAARNAGIDVAVGDVVVFMDADNIVPTDFVGNLRGHYLDGADFVTVESRVVNLERVVGRFQQASHELSYAGLRNVTYSQSFSCRREIAASVRFRDELVGSEDGDFFNRLPLAQCRWSKDPEIVVGHRIPDTLMAFSRQYAWRGKNTVVRRHVTSGTPLSLLTLRQVAVVFYWLVVLALVVPALVGGLVRIRRSTRGVVDFPAFVGLWIVQVLVRRHGELRGLIFLWSGGRLCR